MDCLLYCLKIFSKISYSYGINFNSTNFNMKFTGNGLQPKFPGFTPNITTPSYQIYFYMHEIHWSKVWTFKKIFLKWKKCKFVLSTLLTYIFLCDLINMDFIFRLKCIQGELLYVTKSSRMNLVFFKIQIFWIYDETTSLFSKVMYNNARREFYIFEVITRYGF